MIFLTAPDDELNVIGGRKIVLGEQVELTPNEGALNILQEDPLDSDSGTVKKLGKDKLKQGFTSSFKVDGDLYSKFKVSAIP